jgi:hypothetical protein
MARKEKGWELKERKEKRTEEEGSVTRKKSQEMREDIERRNEKGTEGKRRAGKGRERQVVRS